MPEFNIVALIRRRGRTGSARQANEGRPALTDPEVTSMDGIPRVQFRSRGAKGGLALVAAGWIYGLAEGTAFGAASADADIAKLAATAELLAIDFYTRAIESKRLKGDELAYLAAARDNEQAHY